MPRRRQASSRRRPAATSKPSPSAAGRTVMASFWPFSRISASSASNSAPAKAPGRRSRGNSSRMAAGSRKRNSSTASPALLAALRAWPSSRSSSVLRPLAWASSASSLSDAARAGPSAMAPSAAAGLCSPAPVGAGRAPCPAVRRAAPRRPQRYGPSPPGPASRSAMGGRSCRGLRRLAAPGAEDLALDRPVHRIGAGRGRGCRRCGRSRAHIRRASPCRSRRCP